MWLSFASNEIMNSSAARLHDMLFYDFDIDKVRAAAHAVLQALDDHLTDREIMGKQWIVGNHPTIVDIARLPLLKGDGADFSDTTTATGAGYRGRRIPGFVRGSPRTGRWHIDAPDAFGQLRACRDPRHQGCHACRLRCEGRGRRNRSFFAAALDAERIVLRRHLVQRCLEIREIAGA